jgi:hypothetical protein
MKKPAQVVMLSTNEKAKIGDIVMSKFDDIHILTKNDGKEYAKTVTSQHLYILSDEEIEGGDWFVGFADGSIKPFVMQADESTVEINNWQLNKKGYSSNKKIIATTDRSLKVFIHTTMAIDMDDCYESLPQPSQSFIEKFVDEYNKGNVITEVMVEYESIGAYANPKYNSDYQLKINSDNTINIINSKERWSREEVVEIFNKMFSTDIIDAYVKKVDFDKWIEENL